MFSLLFSCIYGQIILDDVMNTSVAHKATFFQDKNQSISFEDVLKNPEAYEFEAFSKPLEVIDFNSSRWFVRFDVKNTGSSKNIILETARPITNRVDLYEIVGNEIIQEWKSGDDRTFDEKSYPHRKNLFQIHFEPNEVKSFYLVLESDGEVINLPLTFWDKKYFHQVDAKNQLFHGFYFGVLALVIFIFFFFYLMLKEVSFLYYILYVFFLFFLQFSLEGFTFQYIFPNFPYLANNSVLITASGTAFFLVLFAITYLKLKDRLKKWYVLFKSALISFAVLFIVSFSTGLLHELTYPVINLLSLIATISILWVIFLLKKKGYVVSNAFTVGFALLIVGAVIFILGNLGVIGDAKLSELSLKISSGLEVLALSLSMAGRYKELQEEKEKAQEKALENLERIVEERTKEVKKQKLKIEEQHKDMLSSIKYAQRIQEAILPSDEQVKKILPDSFIFYQPKDIVSGDFYFVEQVTTPSGEKVAIFAAVDCTGHGVPGAFMSFLGNNFLTQGTKIKEVNDSAEALNFLNQGIFNALKIKEAQEKGVNIRDGMDIAMVGINHSSMNLSFAGAKNGILIITSSSRKEDFDFEQKNIKAPLFNANESLMLVEIKGDKHPIGLYGEFSESFTNHQYPIKKGDLIYAYSDGYIDQFGGAHLADIKKGGKKFGTKRFKELILSIADLPMEEQKEKLVTTFVDWKGDLENLDDVLVMGVRVK